MTMRVKMNQTMDRRRGYSSPSEADFVCPYFKERFYQWGDVDIVACCEAGNADPPCSYRGILPEATRVEEDLDGDGFNEHIRYEETPEDPINRTVCLRYDYMIKEMIEDVTPVSGLEPIPYILGVQVQKVDTTTGAPLYWDSTVIPPVETTTSSYTDPTTGNITTFDPVMVDTKKVFFSSKYQDSHEKVWGINGGVLGWHHGI